ncbi:ATPase [Serinicoccus chungangensis]|uniref:ATPase n=1 Tax=Serinicoccus chungangensis TaxID=767452 RepID=A0A0W8I2A1_9MICO|nr:SRPBCC family protein [Serinicoccus chungangensis]KUG51865.1 ATPase [Serinicoccus chungangensis]
MDVTVATTFDAPRPLVAAVAGDPDQAMRWYANIRSVRWQGPSELVEGARIDFVARFLGRQLAYTYVVVELVPQERMVMRTDDGPFPMETTYCWWDEEPGDGGRPRTGMSVRNAGRPSAMTTLASGAVTLGMKRAMRRDLERLRLVLREEQDAQATG